MATRLRSTDTIAAVATPPGRGGVGVIRVSGPEAGPIGRALCAGRALPPRQAVYSPFVDRDGETLDRGIAIFFPAPASFTGEDVLELHAHGSPVLLELLLREIAARGARQAEPGEFSQRAFVNGKLDLSQAEAVADLIAAGTERAARSAVRVLEGQLSAEVDAIGVELVALRAWIEASLDFPDDDVDFLDDERLSQRLHAVLADLTSLRRACTRGRVLREGLTLVIAGPPNAGKSSLMNALAGRDVSIVTDIAGTTRDVLREPLALDGVPLHLLDTAGLRIADDAVERAGVERARSEMARADRVLYVVDATFVPAGGLPLRSAMLDDLPAGVPVTVVRNKIDLTGEPPAVSVVTQDEAPASLAVTTVADAPGVTVALSARTGAGLDLLRAHLVEAAGLHDEGGDAVMARARHLTAMETALAALDRAASHLQHRSGELVAEELRSAHEALMQLTGEHSTEDLLGEIFSRFCIGK
jgi:tRNA modification GTPase